MKDLPIGGAGPAQPKSQLREPPEGLSGDRLLFALALFLLSDANLELLLLHVLIGFVIVASHGVRQIRIYIGVFGQNRHQGEAFIARRAERPEPFDVRNCHTKLEYHRRTSTQSLPGART